MSSTISINTIRNINLSQEKYPHTADALQAAVLLLLIEREEVEIVLTQRSKFVHNHRNEVAFPGGAYESMDGDLYQTALRESCEEINLCASNIQFLGSLEKYQTHYGLDIFPFVASIDEKELQRFRPNEEVESIFTIPLKWLKDPNNWEYRDYTSPRDGIRHKVIFYKPYWDYVVWGITARILQGFLSKI